MERRVDKGSILNYEADRWHAIEGRATMEKISIMHGETVVMKILFGTHVHHDPL
jgi:hypothetical protein